MTVAKGICPKRHLYFCTVLIMVKLGRSILDLRVLGSSYCPDLLQNVRGEYLPTLFNSRQKESRGGLAKWKDQCCTA